MESDLTSLLAAGERAVFHGPPGAAVAELERAVATAQRDGKRAEVTAAAWLLGVALSASGRYGSALRVLVPLLEAGEADEAVPELRLFAALAAGTAASVQRGLGRHAGARDLDERGLALTDGTGEAGFDCCLGLVSDAVGEGRLEVARDHLRTAEAVAQPHGDDWWRQRVRLGWARAEVGLLAEDPASAAEQAAASVALAEGSRAPRHVAKSLLFQGVAELSAESEDALATLRRAAALAEQLAALPLVWNARALLGALLSATDSGSDEGARSLASARSAVLTIAGDLPPQLREEWLRRPNVSALLEG